MSEGASFRPPDGSSEEASAKGAADAGSRAGSIDQAAQNRQAQVERRKRRRALISAPVRVRALYAGSHGPEVVSTTVDVSRHGFLFISPHAAFSQGMAVAVIFPYSKSPAAWQAEQPGHVVRVSKIPDGRFAVAIALGEARANAAPVAAEPDNTGADASATGREARPLVIVVDADSEMREALQSFLTAQGYEVMALSGALQAHTLLNQLLPSLLIAEIEGEGLPGLDLCARIKSTPRLERVPVVLTTKSAFPSDYANAHSLGAVVCMAKPFRMERIGNIARLLVPVASGPAQTSEASPSSERRERNSRGDSSDPGFRLSC